MLRPAALFVSFALPFLACTTFGSGVEGPEPPLDAAPPVDGAAPTPTTSAEDARPPIPDASPKPRYCLGEHPRSIVCADYENGDPPDRIYTNGTTLVAAKVTGSGLAPTVDDGALVLEAMGTASWFVELASPAVRPTSAGPVFVMHVRSVASNAAVDIVRLAGGPNNCAVAVSASSITSTCVPGGKRLDRSAPYEIRISSGGIVVDGVALDGSDPLTGKTTLSFGLARTLPDQGGARIVIDDVLVE